MEDGLKSPSTTALPHSMAGVLSALSADRLNFDFGNQYFGLDVVTAYLQKQYSTAGDRFSRRNSPDATTFQPNSRQMLRTVLKVRRTV
jgi:hypothetical protein